MISQTAIQDSEGEIATIYGLSKDEGSLIVRLKDSQLLFVPISLLKVKDNYNYTLNHSFSELRDMAPNSEVYPVIEETPVIKKKIVETERIKIRKTVEDIAQNYVETLAKEEYQILRVPIGETFDQPAKMRVEEDVTYIPVQEEVLVVQKRYLVREEIQIRKIVTEREETLNLHLKKENVAIDRKKVN